MYLRELQSKAVGVAVAFGLGVMLSKLRLQAALFQACGIRGDADSAGGAHGRVGLADTT